MSREVQLQQLVDIIKNYRKDELDFSIDVSHVERWLNQFEADAQDIILSETIYVLKSWYFDEAKIEEVLNEIVNFLHKTSKTESMSDLFRQVSFLSLQEAGLSQKKLIRRLSETINEQYGVAKQSRIDESIERYVYIDDGLYTGNRAKEDLYECLCLLPKGARLDVFYIVAGQNGVQYVEEHLKETASEKKISLFFHRWKSLQNIKYSFRDKNSGEMTYYSRQICLWPIESLKENGDVQAYEAWLRGLPKTCEKYMYRDRWWLNDAGIFTSAENRNVVEKEFLLKGISILKKISHSKGMYPLGFNTWPSFGFGSFCVFHMNISNTCPLVLWWGSNDPKGDALDWYPLFPRRRNPESAQMEKEEMEVFDWERLPASDQYNMCPDCGCYFGVETDGGNGFCINCAWEH